MAQRARAKKTSKALTGAAATPERARHAVAVRRVPTEFAGISADQVDSAVSYLRQQGHLEDRHVAAAELYVEFATTIESFGFPPSLLAKMGVSVQGGGRGRTIPDKVLSAARRLAPATAAANEINRQLVDGVLLADLLPRSGQQVAVLRRALDAIADAFGMEGMTATRRARAEIM